MTQKQIAEQLKVSQAVVSMALTGAPGVSAALRDKVRQLAESSSYRPNLTGQLLRKHRTNLIGVVIPDLSNEFFAELLQCIQSILFKHGFIACFANCNTPKEQEKALAQLRAYHVSGVLLISTNNSLGVEKLREAHIPVVMYGFDNAQSFASSQILPRRAEAAKRLTELLIARGRRKIAFLGGSAEESRFQGCCTALAEAGLPPPELFSWIPEASYLKMGFIQMTKLLERRDGTDAVFAHNDECAIGVYRAAALAGLPIPGAISVVGFDNISSGGYLSPPLTTAEQPRALIADLLVQELEKSMTSPEREERIEIACPVIIRQSI